MAEAWTEKSARAKCRRKLNALKNRVHTLAQDIAYEWGDVDMSIVGYCDELIADVDERCSEIADAMNERVDGEVFVDG